MRVMVAFEGSTMANPPAGLGLSAVSLNARSLVVTPRRDVLDGRDRR
jgi:hypothetical protein